MSGHALPCVATMAGNAALCAADVNCASAALSAAAMGLLACSSQSLLAAGCNACLPKHPSASLQGLPCSRRRRLSMRAHTARERWSAAQCSPAAASGSTAPQGPALVRKELCASSGLVSAALVSSWVARPTASGASGAPAVSRRGAASNAPATALRLQQSRQAYKTTVIRLMGTVCMPHDCQPLLRWWVQGLQGTVCRTGQADWQQVCLQSNTGHRLGAG